MKHPKLKVIYPTLLAYACAVIVGNPPPQPIVVEVK